MLLVSAGNKNGNRRTANIRSIGYSDLYVLSKQDLWDSLLEYPEAKRTLIEKGRQLLRKDNLLDEEVARRQDMEHNTLEEKVEAVESTYDIMNTRIARLLAEFDAMQVELTERLATVEQELHKKDISSLIRVDPPPPPLPSLRSSNQRTKQTNSDITPC